MQAQGMNSWTQSGKGENESESRSVLSNSLGPTLCDPMDCILPGSSVHGILQARILEWVTFPFSRGSSQPRDQTWVFCIASRFFTIWATREARYPHNRLIIMIRQNLVRTYCVQDTVWNELYVLPHSILSISLWIYYVYQIYLLV